MLPVSVPHALAACCLWVGAWRAARLAARPGRSGSWRALSVGLAALGLAAVLLGGRVGEATGLVGLAAVVAAGVFALGWAVRRREEAESRCAALEEECRRWEQRYCFLLERLPEAFVVLEGDRIVYANRAFGKIFHTDGTSARGRLLEAFVAPAWRDQFRQRHSLESTTPSVGVRRLEVEALTAAGESLWVEMRCANSGLEERPAEVVLIADISERRAAERRLQRLTETMLELGADYEANLHRLTALCGELLGATCAMYRRLRGDMLCTMSGWQLPPGYPSAERAEGRLCYDVIRGVAGDGPLVVHQLASSPYAETDPNVRHWGLATYAGFPVASRGQTLGSLCVVYRDEVTVAPADLQVLKAVASALGIEEDRQHARDLQRAAREIAEAAQHAATVGELGAAIHSVVGRLVEAPRFLLALQEGTAPPVKFAYLSTAGAAAAAEEAALRPLVERRLLGDRAQGAGPPAPAAEVACGWLLLPLENRQGTFGVVGVGRQPSRGEPTAAEGEVLAALASQVARAVEHLRAEEQLRQSESKYRTLVDRLQDGMFLVQDARLVVCNEALAHMLGAGPRELEGRDIRTLIAPEDRELVLDRYRRRLAGEAVPGEYEFRLLHTDGRRRIEALMRVGLIEYQGRPATLGTVRDLTERRRLEAQLRQAQRIEALGQLAGGVAHDFNNVLMAIQGSAQLLQHRLGGQGCEELGTILTATQRAAQLTRGLLAFAQRQVLQPQPLDLHRHVAQTLPILRRLIPENISIDFLPCPTPMVVEVDAGQLDQILMNLAVNSRDAMENGGRIVIRTAVAEIGPEYQATHPWARLGTYALLQVCDSGVGMDGHTLAHLFEPFFTTKGVGRGTGLGLSTVYGIVKQHGGMIDVASEPGGGTTVDVYFPLVHRPPAEEEPRAGEQVRGAAELVLVVEDEEEVRQVLVSALREAGYGVCQASDGVAALEVLAQVGGQVALVLSDVVMPRMGGKELWEAAQARGIRVPFLFSSGYGEPFINQRPGAPARVAFLAKPYGIDELLRKVREALGAAGTGRT